jgi:hypothetical protein
MHHLTVIHPFGKYKRGDKIKDEAEVKEITEGENAHHAIRTSDPEETESAH